MREWDRPAERVRRTPDNKCEVLNTTGVALESSVSQVRRHLE
jgi:hypothetical protein